VVQARALDPQRYQLYRQVQAGNPVLDYTSIRQGTIGDCYFIAPIVSLVANGRSKEIVAMIEPLQANTKFMVKFPSEPPCSSTGPPMPRWGITRRLPRTDCG
jgi:hypothetical protein